MVRFLPCRPKKQDKRSSLHNRHLHNHLLDTGPSHGLVLLQPCNLRRHPPKQAHHFCRPAHQRLGLYPTNSMLFLGQICVQDAGAMLELGRTRALLSRSVQGLAEPLDEVGAAGCRGAAENRADGTRRFGSEILVGGADVCWVEYDPIVVAGWEIVVNTCGASTCIAASEKILTGTARWVGARAWPCTARAGGDDCR